MNHFLKFYFNESAFYQVMPKYHIHSGSVFLDTDRSVATVVMESAELFVSQYENV